MTYAATVFLVLLLALVGFAYVFSVRITGRSTRERKRKQAQASQLMLTLSPAYQQKVRDDRTYALQTAELDMKRAEFALKQYLAMHRIPHDTYSVNEELGGCVAKIFKPHQKEDILQLNRGKTGKRCTRFL